MRNIPIERIRRSPYQPRVRFSIGDLAESIRAQGVVQPLVVRPVGGEFELIAGERRWRAAQRAGLAEVPCVVRSISDEKAAQWALVENLQREDLSPMETAQAIARLIEEFKYTEHQVGKLLGKAQSTISHWLRVLDLPPEIQAYLDNKDLELGHAKALLTAPAHCRMDLARKAVQGNWSVRTLERAASKMKQGQRAPTDARERSSDLVALEQRLSDIVGAPVQVLHNAKTGEGEIRVKYFSSEECEGLLARLFGIYGEEE